VPRQFAPTAEGIAALAPYWTSIVGAREQGLRSSDVWGIINEQFQEGGPSFQGATIFDMNHYWARAGELINASNTFNAASPETATDAGMWAWAPWAVPSTAEWQTPNYMLNYAHSALDAEGNVLVDAEGNPIPVYGAHLNDGPLPLTVGDIQGLVGQSAEMALDTGSPRLQAQLGGMGAISLGDLLSVQVMRF
jgi:hypothetical protein